MSSDLNIKYKDVESTAFILEEIKKCRTMKEISDLVRSALPHWIIGFIDRYSNDYPDLTNNWNTYCKELNTKPTQILIVEYVPIKEEGYEVLNALCGLFTKVGFAVRTNRDIQPCTVCDAGIPTQNRYNFMKSNGITNLPETWSPCCIECKTK